MYKDYDELDNVLTPFKFSNIFDEESLHNIGIGDYNGTINYCGLDVSSSMNMETSTAQIARLDDFLKSKPVTFIKMDIEGAEMAALHGAAEIITRLRPKLAISCYHQHRNGVFMGNSDLFDVPSYVKSLVPEYQILIRHHKLGWDFYETVCYAIPQ